MSFITARLYLPFYILRAFSEILVFVLTSLPEHQIAV